MRFFIHLSYVGTNYRGWQSQLLSTSVQEKIESALGKILKAEVKVYGCGRTDAMVHGLNYVAHFNIDELPVFDLKERLNFTLPHDICVHTITQVEDWRHARFDAVSRSYTYLLHTEKCAFKNNFSAYYPLKSIDIQKISDIISIIKKQTEFKAFCNSADKHNSTICQIQEFSFTADESQNLLIFNIRANRFLKQMIRIIIGTLIRYINQEISKEQILQGFGTGAVNYPKLIAHPSGLYFTHVEYEYISFDPITIWPWCGNLKR